MGSYALNCVRRTQLFGHTAMVWPGEPGNVLATVFTAWRQVTMLRQLQSQAGQSPPLDRAPRMQPALDEPSIDRHRSRHRSRSRHEPHEPPGR